MDKYLEFEIIEDPIIEFDIEVGTTGGMLPMYEGPYEVTPRKVEQHLATAHKSMAQDVKIFAIPYAETTNPEGGTTVTIGLE